VQWGLIFLVRQDFCVCTVRPGIGTSDKVMGGNHPYKVSACTSYNYNKLTAYNIAFNDGLHWHNGY